MPIGELWAVRVALRETRQGVFGLQNMLADGFDADVMQANPPSLAAAVTHLLLAVACTQTCLLVSRTTAAQHAGPSDCCNS